MTASAATAWVAERLCGQPRPAPVLAAGRHAVYVDDGGVALGVLARTATQLPVGLRTRLGALPDIDQVVVGAGCIRLGDLAVEVTRIVTARVPRLPSLATRAGCLLSGTAPGADARLDAVCAQLPAQALVWLGRGAPAAVLALLGRGDGLTPVGDDVLAGWLITRHALQRPVRAVADAIRVHRSQTTTLSATLLDRAAGGESVLELRELLTAVTSSRLTALLDVGHSSGAGLALGARLAVTAEEAA